VRFNQEDCRIEAMNSHIPRGPSPGKEFSQELLYICTTVTYEPPQRSGSVVYPDRLKDLEASAIRSDLVCSSVHVCLCGPGDYPLLSLVK
jgi:hypothetical protein